MKILVIQNRMGIGDMIMFLPFIKAISNHYGEQVSLMVKKSTKASEYLNEEKYIKEIKMEYLVDDWFVKKRVYEL